MSRAPSDNLLLPDFAANWGVFNSSPVE